MDGGAGVIVRPTVDLTIATIGRASLRAALMAALQQTYSRTRVVVIGDGPRPDARRIFESLKPFWNPAHPRPLYLETDSASFGYGDFVKRWWIDNAQAGEFIRFLDDDDWIPPNAIAEMVNVIGEHTSLVLCGLVMTLGGAVDLSGAGGRWRVVRPKLAEHHANSGTSMLRTVDARLSEFPNGAIADYELAAACAKRGAVKLVDMPLYWYSGHQGGKTRSVNMKAGMPYHRPWLFKAPRTFRKSLFSRVPKVNFFDGSGRPLLVYDQGLFRPFHRIARKRAWINRRCYYYDQAPAARKCYSHDETASSARFIMQRGYLSVGDPYPPVPENPDAPAVCIVVPAYGHADKIGRCLRSIAKQDGDWECVVTVDGADEATADAARSAVRGDGRFRVIVQEKHLYPLGNVLEVITRIPENQIVMFVDADDYLTQPDVVEEVIDKYTDPDVEIVCGGRKAMIIAGSQSDVERRAPQLRERLKWLEAKLHEDAPDEDLTRWRTQRGRVLEMLTDNGALA